MKIIELKPDPILYGLIFQDRMYVVKLYGKVTENIDILRMANFSMNLSNPEYVKTRYIAEPISGSESMVAKMFLGIEYRSIDDLLKCEPMLQHVRGRPECR